ncbi:asparagine synthase (glutamine-hydrolyzing) [Castellaniella denitrificans]|uniref:asparagine synthase (glutamine-hydrolyzing) n=1 Tax=Castellaniella denitrificans TaxID=56119 RepID=A0ABT4M367_9BURK|nr:asparagine synthase (glutamine-hydrolyzing) [Castellaniella denitrificans]MCZ4328556.1 asparagine synthase (glutamine-hydrolyzing) [Castellaniella denitrificans]
MCGLAGFFGPFRRAADDSAEILRKQGLSIALRGPDSDGIWHDDAVGFGVTHRRLSISDLSLAGHQPMASHCGRYILAFNGEIYNHRELRSRLEQEEQGNTWRGHSDTEVLLTCLARWGLDRTLQACVGMFAFALWDRQDRTLTLARDRMGEKPLYWGWQGQTLLFGSELKALRAHPDFQGMIDRDALTLLLRYNYIPAPYSIYRGIRKLPAGHYVVIGVGDRDAMPRPFWDYRNVVRAGLETPFTGTDGQAIDELEARLMTSIQGQRVADVPLGAFLSGGIDSSLVVSLMQRQASQRVNTYAIGFQARDFDEAVHARAVADHLGTDHAELYVTEQDALAIVPELPRIYCEPFADSSQIPTFLVSRMARQHVTVALSGDGGDELFGGYTPYQFMPRLWRWLRMIPAPLRQGIAAMLVPLPAPQRIEKLLTILGATSREDLYLRVRSHWMDTESMILGANEPDSLLRHPDTWRFVKSFEVWMMSLDACGYMPDDILVKVDRAAMANSLETRVPLLDHRVVEFAARLPLSMKIRDGRGKWVLRQLLYRYVPQSLVDRPKAGFAVPLGSWLRGPLREWAEDLLQEPKLRKEGYFDAKRIQEIWQEHLNGRADRSNRLWSILIFQAWLADQ